MSKVSEQLCRRAAAAAVLATVLAAACIALAAAPASTSRPRLGPGRPDRQRVLPVAVDPAPVVVADDEEEKPVPVTTGVADAGHAGAVSSSLPADGEMLESRLCRLRRDPASGWVLVELLDDELRPAGLASWALPCGVLEEMEREMARRDEALFRVSGEFSLYEGRSYLLLTKASLAGKRPPRREASSQPATATAASRPAVVPASRPAYFAATQAATSASSPATAQSQPASAAVSRPATGPASQAGIPEALPGVSAEEIIAELRKDVIVRPVVEEPRPTTPRPNEEAVPPLPTERVLESQRGSYVVDRLAVVMPAGKARWLQVRFVSDNNLLEPPLRLLPCAMLRRAELKMASAYKGNTVYLKISGLMTYYKGQRFLMLRKVVEEPHMDRF